MLQNYVLNLISNIWCLKLLGKYEKLKNAKPSGAILMLYSQALNQGSAILQVTFTTLSFSILLGKMNPTYITLGKY